MQHHASPRPPYPGWAFFVDRPEGPLDIAPAICYDSFCRHRFLRSVWGAEVVTGGTTQDNDSGAPLRHKPSGKHLAEKKRR